MASYLDAHLYYTYKKDRLDCAYVRAKIAYFTDFTFDWGTYYPQPDILGLWGQMHVLQPVNGLLQDVLVNLEKKLLLAVVCRNSDDSS